MSIIISCVGKKAVVINGRMYRFLGSHVPNGPRLTTFEPFYDPATNQPNLGRGRTIYFEVDLKAMTLILQKGGKNGQDLIIPDKVKFRQHNDMIFIDEPKYAPQTSPRFTQLNRHRVTPFSYARAYQRQRRVGTVLLDGKLIESVNDERMLKEVVITEGNFVMKTIAYVPMNEDTHRDDDTQVITDYDGNLHVLGPGVLCSSEKERAKVTELLP